MRRAVFSSKPYEGIFLEAANHRYGHELTFLEPRLTPETAPLAAGFPAVCVSIDDRVEVEVLEVFAAGGTRLVALRCVDSQDLDFSAARRLGIEVARIPTYSPHAVAEHTVALILTLNRKLHHAYNRVSEWDFDLDGLLGHNLCGRSVGIIGTGKVGGIVARIMRGFECQVLAHDPHPSPELVEFGVQYSCLETLLATSDIVTLHCPLTPETHHLIDDAALCRIRPGVMLINTSAAELVDLPAVISALNAGQVGYLGVDVYEEDADPFQRDRLPRLTQDEAFLKLLTLPNVVVTVHQGFFTSEAMQNIAEATLQSVSAFEEGEARHLVTEG
jgi:D-lactate dehydrogenase